MILLDVKDLDHPVPLEMALEALELLEESRSDDKNFIRMIHRREPYPLYEILKKRNFAYSVRPFRENGRDLFEIDIRRKE